MSLIVFAGLIAGLMVLLEALAWAGHKYILHGPAWGLHRTHHENSGDVFELNDVVSLGFAALAIALFLVGDNERNWATATAIAMTLYGALYALVHEGLAHRRFDVSWLPMRGYLKRLVQAHRLHHACRDRQDGVSHGFLYAPPVKTLVAAARRRVRPDQVDDNRASMTSAARSAPPAR